MKRYIFQAWAQMRQQPVMSIITIAGTALAIFLIMLVVMLQQVKVAPFSPESNRDRFLHVHSMSITTPAWGGGDSNGPMSVQTAKDCFQSLQTPEAVTIYVGFPFPRPAALPGHPSVSADVRETDDVFFRVFDFRFIAGKPYDKATFDAGIPVAVITESIARSVFGRTDVAGQEFLLSHVLYKVCGVVRDVSTLATAAYGQIWIPYTTGNMYTNNWCEDLMGEMSCTILAKDRSDFPAIRSEVNRRALIVNSRLKSQGWKLIYRNRPYDQEKQAINFAANIEPDLAADRRERFVIYLILVIGACHQLEQYDAKPPSSARVGNWCAPCFWLYPQRNHRAAFCREYDGDVSSRCVGILAECGCGISLHSSDICARRICYAPYAAGRCFYLDTFLHFPVGVALLLLAQSAKHLYSCMEGFQGKYRASHQW